MDEPPRLTVWWRNTHGQWWVVGQFLLGFFVLAAPPAGPSWPPVLRLLAVPVALAGGVLVVLGAAALGPSLTILPRPRARGTFVRRGVYRLVRHPIYGGVILLALAYAIGRTSLLHVALTVAFAVFFWAKARREERWLTERFPEYAAYRRQVRGFIPWVV